MMNLKVPLGYKSNLNLLQTQYWIKEIKDFFQQSLAKNLNLVRVSAPMFVKQSTGINDYLSGIEKPVSFEMEEENGINSLVEIVHSLAKWKRYALEKYNIPKYSGIYTDMNAIRSFEVLDNTHSVYVDQWDWEKVIDESDVNEEYLKETVRNIFNTFKELEEHLASRIYDYKRLLPDNIFFITAQQLEYLYPELTPEKREREIAKDKKAVFLMKIGDTLESGIKHGDRSPDYDDWDLNGDILIWNPILDDVLELSSMGIRVSPSKLVSQLEKSNTMDRVNLEYHSKLINNELPQTIGGGIGQSRICMLFLQKAHIGEVQSSIWPEEMVNRCEDNNIILL
ncbi:MAG: aspartate--ammonia ligase [Tissierellia bacterium]|nr:aspartate--ammonia ligase [Tissierellia bacterium]